ncbi:MAG: response regulator [Endomicrobium sp.]|jgi:DNA-binding response OmpR family regulator|uniref:response regulator n=1 Tax=Candidatus Endomicrobiellum cubanum TaxID=3242325 RepID=UPI00281CDAED|nr:response regulator [Endomicrobium sp.]
MVRKKLLVVDDDATFLDSIDIFFSGQGFSVIKLLNPRNIFNVLKEEIPDIILLDVCFSEDNGFDVLNKLKSHYQFSNIPVVMMTADVTVHVDKAFAQGVDDCIFKPINVEDVIKRVTRLL